MLERDYNYFIFNIDELLSKYKDEYIVIKEKTVIGHYNSFDEAYAETCKKEEIGTFIIQHCVVKDHEQAMQFAWNNVSFEQTTN